MSSSSGPMTGACEQIRHAHTHARGPGHEGPHERAGIWGSMFHRRCWGPGKRVEQEYPTGLRMAGPRRSGDHDAAVQAGLPSRRRETRAHSLGPLCWDPLQLTSLTAHTGQLSATAPQPSQPVLSALPSGQQGPGAHPT